MSAEKSYELSRREFLKIMSTAGAGLVIGIYLGGCDETITETPSVIPSAVPSATLGEGVTPAPSATPEEERPPLPTAEPGTVLAPNIYLEIDPNGDVTITAFRSEMGQGVRTAIAMILADELDVPWEAVKVIEQATANPEYGDQVTGGSASISDHYTLLRSAGAVVRRMLVNAAAQYWEVDPNACSTEPGEVVHPDGQERLTYGVLVAAAVPMEIPRTWEVPLKAEEDFRIQGQRIGHWDAGAIVTGKAVYGLDVRLPGMLYAAMARCPVFGGEPASFDATAALQVPGVQHAQQIRDWIAVVAENTWAAFQGRAALAVTWEEGRHAEVSSEEVYTRLGDSLPIPTEVEVGTLAAIYDIPFEAHMTMEPMNCTAHIHDGVCEVWAPTQSPQRVLSDIVSATGMRREAVTVNVTLIGGGFGRRLQSDYAVEAVLVSQAIGAPVQVVWSREDDIQHDFYHPMSRHLATVALDNLRQRRVRSISTSAIPTGAWRSVGNFPEAYANECFIDEIAVALERDPVDLRLELFSGRAYNVIQLAADKAGWGEPLPAGWGRGIAYHATFGVTHVAQVAEVEVSAGGEVRVHRVVCAVDCGKVVNPDTVEAQMEGGIAFGLTAALKAQVTVVNGRVQQSNYHDCPVLRIDEMPQVEVYIVDSDNNPTGIGEMGVPPIAPAVVNAVFAATGKRVRHIPIRPEDLSD